MIEGLQPYSEYKESGLPWLGRCPDHWKVRRTKILFQERVQKGFPNEPLLAATQTKGVVRKEDYETRTVTAQKDLHLLKLVEVGDYVISLRSFQGGIEVAHYRGIISPAYTVLKPRGEAKSGYYSKFFKSRQFIDSLSLFVTGIREGQNIDYERMSRAEMPCPPPDEQAAIVRFLDHANRKIDGFIRAKRKLIALLGEQKQAIIHRAVTGQDQIVERKRADGTSAFSLEPSAFPKKPSGIPWLGDIPQHWELTKLRRICFYQEGPGLRTWQFKESGIQVICVTNITASGVNLGAYGRYISREEYNSKYRHFTVERGDLMLASSGNSWGKVAEFDGPETVILNTSTIRLNPTRFGKVSKAFLKFVLGADYIRNQLLGLLTGSCQPNFGPSHLNRLLVAFPTDHAEQAEVVEHVSSEIAPLNTAIARTEREIALMQEYRTRLTADVVTGKLDVRPLSAVLLPTARQAGAQADCPRTGHG